MFGRKLKKLALGGLSYANYSDLTSSLIISSRADFFSVMKQSSSDRNLRAQLCLQINVERVINVESLNFRFLPLLA